MAVKQPIKWHGGKYYLADTIIKLMPPHKHYVEPYAGGLAVLFRKSGHGVSEAVNDINKSIANFYRVLRDKSKFEEFSRIVQLTPFHEEEFKESRIGDSSHMDVEMAVKFFIKCRQSRQGLGKSFATLSKSRTRRGMNEQVSSWLSSVDGLKDVHDRLRKVVIFSRDALRVIESEDSEHTLFYCDPPYLEETRSAFGQYEYEMIYEQHKELLSALGSISGRFILSGYKSPLYNSWAKENGYNRMDIKTVKHSSGLGLKSMATECLWYNYNRREQ